MRSQRRGRTWLRVVKTDGLSLTPDSLVMFHSLVPNLQNDCGREASVINFITILLRFIREIQQHDSGGDSPDTRPRERVFPLF